MMSRERADDGTAVESENPEESAPSERVTVSDPDVDADPDAVADPETVTDTFTLLSDETRVRIVLALDEAPDDRPLRFSELRSAVGVRDGGRFNYHLDRLCGRLVEKTDDGYALSREGERVAAIV